MTPRARQSGLTMSSMMWLLIQMSSARCQRIRRRRQRQRQRQRQRLSSTGSSVRHDAVCGTVLQRFTDAQRVMHWRNQLLHAIWMIYAEHQTALALRRSGKTEDSLTGQALPLHR